MSYNVKSRKYCQIFELQSPESFSFGKGLSQQMEHMRVPNDTGPEVWRSERHLSEYATCINDIEKPNIVDDIFKNLIVLMGSPYQQYNVFDTILIIPDVSLSKKIIWKSQCPPKWNIHMRNKYVHIVLALR